MVPGELVDHEVWCANRRLVPFGEFGTVAGDVAVDQFRVYMGEWAAVHGVDEDDMDLVGAAPWDPSAL